VKIKPCIFGLGYIGLPLFQELKKNYVTVGYDKNIDRVNELNNKIDRNYEYRQIDLINKNSIFTYNQKDVADANFYIVCVPTPIYKNKKPNLNPLIVAINTIANYIKKNDIIFIESTVYPGTTENICKKNIEKKTKLKEGKDFYIGYSPERINPGDKVHTVKNVKKIVSIKTDKKLVLDKVKKIYKSISRKIIITENIKEAEAAKVFENVQRDVNIALINELFLIAHKLKINFHEVYKLASTKWNFLPFKPGLVGGHCLPVDPYYLSYISKKNNYNPKMLLAGREINDSMEKHIIKIIIKKISNIKNKKILFIGLSYKKNVSDMRNSLAFNVFNYFVKKKYNVTGLEPHLPLSMKFKNVIKKIKIPIKYNIVIVLNKHNNLDNIVSKIKKDKKILLLNPFIQS